MKLLNWIETKTKRDKLRERYCALMKKAYQIAPKNKRKSDLLNREAKSVLRELRKIEFSYPQ